VRRFFAGGFALGARFLPVEARAADGAWQQSRKRLKVDWDLGANACLDSAAYK
jgi:hypothetical protein